MNKRKENILTLRLPYRENLHLQRSVFSGGGSGPRVAIVSGIHGDELEGLFVCHRLAAWLENLEKQRPEALLGQIELYPSINPLGLDTLERLVPSHRVDLNRNFPGHPQGLMPQRMAHALLEALNGAALVVDIHASNIYLREIPQVRINEAFAARLLPMARNMNLDVIWLHGAVTVLQATLAHSLNDKGIPCLVAEMGVGMRVTPTYCDQLVTGIIHNCRNLGVLANDLDILPLSHTPLVANDTNVVYLNAPTSGLFVPEIEHWIEVEKGQRLGIIVSPLQGEVLAEICSPCSGTLFTLREYPLVYEGSLTARIIDANRMTIKN